MVFFSKGDNKQRLAALYLLRAAKQPLSREQLITAMMETGESDYFTAAQQISDLEQNKYIASVPVFNRQMTAITSLGEETVHIFDNTLPKSFRNTLDKYICTHEEEYHQDNTSRVLATPRPDGSVDMVFALVEAGEALFEIRFRLPDTKYAQRALHNWENINEEIYISTVLKLTNEDERKSRPKREGTA